MHVITSWDIGATGAKWTQLNERMLEVLKPYAWVKPVNTFYMIPNATVQDRAAILNGLTAVQISARPNVPIFFVTSPLIQNGHYDGVLTQDVWNAVNQRVA